MRFSLRRHTCGNKVPSLRRYTLFPPSLSGRRLGDVPTKVFKTTVLLDLCNRGTQGGTVGDFLGNGDYTYGRRYRGTLGPYNGQICAGGSHEDKC